MNHSTQEVSIVSEALNPSAEISYDPSPASVKKGSTITWTNNDSAPHTATSGNPESGSDDVFDTGIIGPANSAKVIVDFGAGTYDYYCTLHPYMKGKLTVG